MRALVPTGTDTSLFDRGKWIELIPVGIGLKDIFFKFEGRATAIEDSIQNFDLGIPLKR